MNNILKQKIFRIIFLTIILISLTMLVNAQGITLKMGHDMTPESAEGRAYQFFADKVMEETGGEIEVILYPANQLGERRVQIDSVLIGTQDIYATGASIFATFDPLFSISTLPFLFKDSSSFTEMMQGDIGQQQKEIFEKNGLVVLNPARNFMRGPERILASTKAIRSVEDVKGIRFRTYENEIYMTAWKILGAKPIIIPWNETYLALKQGIVDAATGPLVQLYSMKWTEVCPYVSHINEYTSDCLWAMNKDKFDSLTPEQQEILVRYANEAGDYFGELQNETIEKDIEKMKKEHGTEFIEIDTTPFRDALLDYYYKLEEEGKIPVGTVDSALKE